MNRQVLLFALGAGAFLLWRRSASASAGLSALGSSAQRLGTGPVAQVTQGDGLKLTALPPAPSGALSADPTTWRPGSTTINVVPAAEFESRIPPIRRRGIRGTIELVRAGGGQIQAEWAPKGIVVLGIFSSAVDGSNYPEAWQLNSFGGRSRSGFAALPYPSMPGQPGRVGTMIRSVPGFSEGGVGYVQLVAATNGAKVRSVRGLIQFVGTNGGRFALVKVGSANQYKVAAEPDVARMVINQLGADTDPRPAESWYYRLPYIPPPSWPLAASSGQWIVNATRRASQAARDAIEQKKAAADTALKFGAALGNY